MYYYYDNYYEPTLVPCEFRTKPDYYELFLLCEEMGREEDLSNEEGKGIIAMARESASVVEISK